MKSKKHVFTKPVKVLQVFKNINFYGKKHKAFSDRKEDLAWHPIRSSSGFVRNGALYLPTNILNKKNINSCDIITMEDHLQEGGYSSLHLGFQKVVSFETDEPNNQVGSLKGAFRFDIFELENKKELELNLLYGQFTIGIPKRNDFKLCELKQNKVVQIKINGKTDNTLTAGRERIFKEQEYIISYLGEFNTCFVVDEAEIAQKKTIPTIDKLIDLNKRLW